MEAPGPTIDQPDLEPFETGLEVVRNTGDRLALIRYCEEYLRDLTGGLKDVHEKRAILALSASIRCAMSKVLKREKGAEAAIADMEIAVNEATESGYHDAIYDSYSALGRLYDSEGYDDLAANMYQRALPYAWQVWPHMYLSTLQRLAWIWEKDEDTVDKATLMYEWMLMLEPTNFDTYVRRYKTILLDGYGAELAEEANQDVEPDCVAYAHNVAMNLVLERHDHAIAAARAGRKLAREQEDFAWKEIFSKILTDEMERGR